MFVVLGIFNVMLAVAFAQELGGAGTVQGIVKDPTDAVMQAAEVELANSVSGFNRTTTSDAAGEFVFRTPITSLSRLRGSVLWSVTWSCALACRSISS